MPNDSVLIRRFGLMQRREGHWRSGLAAVDRAASLDPRNILSLGWLPGTYEDVHIWAAAEEMRQRGLAVALTSSPQEVAPDAMFDSLPNDRASPKLVAATAPK